MFDSENMWSDGQALTATAVSDNTIFVGRGDAGSGTAKAVEIDSTPATGGGSIVVDVQTADTDAGPFDVVASIPVSAEALAIGGAVKVFHLPTGLKDYVQLNYNVTGTLTGCEITAGIVGIAGQTNVTPAVL